MQNVKLFHHFSFCIFCIYLERRANLLKDEDLKDDVSTQEQTSNETNEEDSNGDQKSLLDRAKEIEAKERLHELELENRQCEAHEREREDYAKKLQQDKIELIRLKQGIIDQSETIHEEHEVERELSFKERVYNFFYHNIWWLWIVAFVLVVVTYITYSIVTTPKPDTVVLMFVTDDELYSHSDSIAEYFEQFAEDVNQDGECLVKVYYIPLGLDPNDINYTSYMAKFTGEMQSANSMIVIADSSCDELLKPESTLYDLSNDFPNVENVKDYGYYLNDTDFAEYIGYEGTLEDDIYLGIRKVQKVYDSEETMQENFDIAISLFTKLLMYNESGDILNG